MIASLYIHIPFCVSLCDYCDFYSELTPHFVSGSKNRMDQFVDTLIQELDVAFSHYAITAVPTLYIGGGTPSVLGTKRLETILDHLHGLIKLWPVEATVEVNPESMSEDLMAMLRYRDINRLSLGIQSLREKSRRAVNRSGTVDQCLCALDLAGRYFPDAFSVDLMSGLPFQNTEELCGDIDRMVSAGATHVSLYSLTLEDSTPLAAQIRSGLVELPVDEMAEELWLAGRDMLCLRGLVPYEVSNFSVPGHESRHNMRYWHMKNWIGCGPSASSTIISESDGTAARHTNAASLGSYLDWNGQTIPPGQDEPLDRETLLRESLMMGFRTLQGPDEALFLSRFHQSIESLIPRTLKRWSTRELVQKNRMALTPEGLLLLNSFLVDCFQELEQSTSPASS